MTTRTQPSLLRAVDLAPPRLSLSIDRAFRQPLETLAGRVVQLSGAATLSVGMYLLYHVQVSERPSAFVTATRSMIFAPDVHAAGIELSRLLIVDGTTVESALRATDVVLRSGQFACVMLDTAAALPLAALARWMRLCEQHRAIVCILAPDARNSLASTVSLHVHTSVSYTAGGQLLRLRVLRSRDGFSDAQIAAYGPAGVR